MACDNRNVYVAGYYGNTTAGVAPVFGAIPLPLQTQSQIVRRADTVFKGFVAKIAGATGAEIWAKGYGDDAPAEQPSTQVAALLENSPSGVIVAGSYEFTGNLSFAPNISVAGLAQGVTKFIARFDGDGKPIAARLWDFADIKPIGACISSKPTIFRS
jgi:hypothetical protein